MLVEIRSLAVRLGGAPILRDVNLTLNEGEIYGLLGPNGAGKSTTWPLTEIHRDGGGLESLYLSLTERSPS